MRRPLLVVLTVCAPAAPQGLEEHPSAPTVFREPDAITAREIDDLMSHKGLGSGTRRARTKSRARLREIGRWTVPHLCDAIAGKKRRKGVRIPMNAIMTLGRILDPDCLAAVREAAGTKQADVRKTACLILGLFERGADENVALLKKLLEERARENTASQNRRACALALGRIDHKQAAATLVAHTRPDLPKDDKFLAAAILLGATVRSKEAQPERFLGHDEEIVRLVAATGLLIRPLESRDRDLVEKALKRRRKDRRVRPLLYHALAAIHHSDIRARLLECATRSDEREERLAALIGLAYEWGNQDDFRRLNRARARRRNDPTEAAMLFALAQTGAPAAVKELMKVVRSGSDLLRFYAGGSLLYLVFLSQPGKRHPREQDVCELIADLRSASDPRLKALADMARIVRAETDLVERSDLARREFASPEMRDPYGLHLWDWTQEDRAWEYVNRLIPAVFDLDDIAEKSDPDNLGEAPGGGAVAPGGRAPPPGTPVEQDLIDFLNEEPYYGPEDLGER